MIDSKPTHNDRKMEILQLLAKSSNLQNYSTPRCGHLNQVGISGVWDQKANTDLEILNEPYIADRGSLNFEAAFLLLQCDF